MFFSKTPVQKLQKEYKKLIGEAHMLSKTNRSASDQKYFEAEEVMKKLEQLTNK